MAASRASDSDRKLKYMQAFQSLGPPTYAGNSDFVEAEDWLRRVTKCMDAIDVPVKLRVTFAAFMLTGEADRWWEFTQRGREVGSMTWEDFERRFQRMYFPNNVQCSNKRTEFYNLTQGDMTVAQYVAKFIQLSRYAHIPQTEDLKIEMFIRGLNPFIKLRMPMASEFIICEDAVNLALLAESFEEDWKRREETSDCEASGSGGKVTGSKSSSRSNRYRPFHCYKCGKAGHIQRNCPGNRSPSSDYNGGY